MLYNGSIKTTNVWVEQRSVRILFFLAPRLTGSPLTLRIVLQQVTRKELDRFGGAFLYEFRHSCFEF